MPKPKDRDDIPYGCWIGDDGTAYLFNRKYEPIWRKEPGKKAVPADRTAWVPHVSEFYFWDDFTDIGHRPILAGQMRRIRDSFINHVGMIVK